jgi:hypothetical protein
MLNLIKKDFRVFSKGFIPVLAFLAVFETVLFWLKPDNFVHNCTFVNI